MRNATFGLITAYDLYEKLKYDAKLLLRDRPETEEEQRLEEYEAFNFFVTAWHLHYDWIVKNENISKPIYAVEKIKIAYPTMKEVRHAVRDLANGSKHFVLDDPKVSVGEREISSYTSFFFGPQYPIDTETQHYLMDDLVFVVLEYFAWIFDDDAPLFIPDSIVARVRTATELRIARNSAL